MLGDFLAAVLNPSAEQLARRDAWVARHPVAAFALATSPGWALPLIAATGWLS